MPAVKYHQKNATGNKNSSARGNKNKVLQKCFVGNTVLVGKTKNLKLGLILFRINQRLEKIASCARGVHAIVRDIDKPCRCCYYIGRNVLRLVLKVPRPSQQSMPAKLIIVVITRSSGH